MNSAVLLVKQCGVDNYQWLRFGDSADNVQTGDSEALAQASAGQLDIAHIAATQEVSIRQVEFETHEKKILHQTIPYTLEDDLLDDVDQLHFALGPIDQQQVAVAWLKKEQLENWLAMLADQHLDVQYVVPELLLLPEQREGWTLLIDDDRWLLKSGPYQGFALEEANAGLALQLLLDESDQLPESLEVYAGNLDQAHVLNNIPELLRGMVDWREGDYWQLICTNEADTLLAACKRLDLLQGAYERKLPWRKWWQTWRVAAVLLLGTVIVQFVAGFSELKSLQNTNQDLRVEIEQIYRSVVPTGAVVNPEKQLSRKVRALEGGSGGGFINLLDKIAQVVSQTEGLTIHSLNYTEKQSEIRMTVIAPAFDNVETARANMEKQGLTAQLVGSSTEQGKTRARLRIRS